jgi:hypothetical protein
MDYDDSSRRLNLLSGLVFGTVLGAGLALLFGPGERREGGRPVVVRAAKSLGRGARAGAGSARARLSAARARRREYEGGDGDPDVEDHDLDDHGADDQDGGGPVTARSRVEGMARRRFTL